MIQNIISSQSGRISKWDILRNESNVMIIRKVNTKSPKLLVNKRFNLISIHAHLISKINNSLYHSPHSYDSKMKSGEQAIIVQYKHTFGDALYIVMASEREVP